MKKLNEKKASVETLYKNIFSIKESLQDAISTAQETANVASEFGGEISRVITSQISEYLVPVLSKYIEDPQTPGSVAPLITFLDSVPLAMTREEPNPDAIAPSPIDTTASQQVQAPPVLDGAAAMSENKRRRKEIMAMIEEIEGNVELDDEIIEMLADKWDLESPEAAKAIINTDSKLREE